MKYTGGKSTFNNQTKQWDYQQRVYTDFYCSLAEWAQLKHEKSNFMYQVREKIGENYRPSLDRTGRRDGTETEEYSAELIKKVIKLITHKDSKVEFYSWKGNIMQIIIEFPNCKMPNIIILVDEYGGSTNRILIDCIDAIYATLHDKTTKYYDTYLYKMYNNKYDRIFYKSHEDIFGYFLEWKYKWQWKDLFRKAEDRVIEDNNMFHLTYKKYF